uniref:Uncharacterized protein n=1 Tax=viral metagenome TaxID=1070528 RepID=A0A6M3MGL3_9ZZZZ
MRYNIMGLDQTRLVKHNLDVSDALILQYFTDFIASHKMITKIVKGDIYYWINYRSVLAELPILKIKKHALANRLKKYVKAGLLKHITVKKAGTFSFYSPTDEIHYMKYSKETVCSEMHTPIQSTTDPLCSEVDNKYPLLNEPSAKDYLPEANANASSSEEAPEGTSLNHPEDIIRNEQTVNNESNRLNEEKDMFPPPAATPHYLSPDDADGNPLPNFDPETIQEMAKTGIACAKLNEKKPKTPRPLPYSRYKLTKEQIGVFELYRKALCHITRHWDRTLTGYAHDLVGKDAKALTAAVDVTDWPKVKHIISERIVPELDNLVHIKKSYPDIQDVVELIKKNKG